MHRGVKAVFILMANLYHLQEDELGEGDDDDGKEQPSTTGSLGNYYYFLCMEHFLHLSAEHLQDSQQSVLVVVANL